MKRHLVPAILTLCALLALTAPLVAQQAAPSESGPRVIMPEPVFDAGKIAKGEKITHDFVIRNDGEATLEITDVRPACGCTVADYDRTIAPGASGKVHAVVDTTTFAGPISKGITVLTNDPVNPRLQLSVKAVVQPYLFVQPGFARFVQPQLSKPGKIEQIVFTTTFDDLQIEKVESPYPFLTVDYKLAGEDDEPREQGVGPQYIFTFTLDYDRAPIGTLADYVSIYTNHPNQRVLKVPVSGFVRPMISVTPTEADFGEIELDGERQASMLIRSFAEEDVKVTGAVSSVPGVELQVEPLEEGRRYTLQVTLKPDMPKGPFDGTITISTDSAKKPVVEVPLRGTAI